MLVIVAAPLSIGKKMRACSLEYTNGSIAGFFRIFVWYFDQEFWHTYLIKNDERSILIIVPKVGRACPERATFRGDEGNHCQKLGRQACVGHHDFKSCASASRAIVPKVGRACPERATSRGDEGNPHAKSSAIRPCAGHTILSRARLPVVKGAEGGNRTHMPDGHTILSRARLPVPPLRLKG